MDIDIKSNWNIELESKKEADITNPFSKSKSYIINDKYFLKCEELNLLKTREMELKTLEKLKNKNVPILMPIGNKIVESNSRIFQLLDLFQQTNINFEKDLTKADSIGYELSKLSSINLDNITKEDIQDNLCKLQTTLIEKSDEKQSKILSKCFEHLNNNFFPFNRFYNFKLSHGDFHPNNLFVNEKVDAIIDWELIANREELYDLAFLIGCVGLEDPRFLYKDWIKELIMSYSDSINPNKLAFYFLPEMVMALRIKWMYKWLINQEDKEIIDMETDYLKIIIENIEDIRKLWLSYLNTDFKHIKTKIVMQDAFMVEDIEKAKEKLKDIDLDNFDFNKYEDKEELATNLRLLGIDYGMKDDLISVLKIVNLIIKLSDKNKDNKHILVEKFITIGNSCLDLSKFGLIDALKGNIKDAEHALKISNVDEIKIGYSFMLRNTSIAFAENDDYENMLKIIEKFIKFNQENNNIEIKGEFARALSNAITSLIQKNDMKEKIKQFYKILEELYEKNKDSRKINGAYRIAKSNLEKFL